MKATATNLSRPGFFTNKPWPMRSLACLACILAFCISCNDSEDERYSVSLEGDATMFNNAKARVRLFGINSTYADVGATIIDDNIMAVTDLPELYELDWPKNAHTLIQNPSVTDPSNALYSISVTIDVDGDGMMCQGDLRQDFDASPFESFSARPTSTTTIVMTEQEVDFCRQFSVDVPVEL